MCVWVRGLTAAMVTTEVSLIKQKNMFKPVWERGIKCGGSESQNTTTLQKLYISQNTIIYAQTHKIFFGNSRQFLGTFKTNSVMLSTRVFGGKIDKRSVF